MSHFANIRNMYLLVMKLSIYKICSFSLAFAIGKLSKSVINETFTAAHLC